MQWIVKVIACQLSFDFGHPYANNQRLLSVTPNAETGLTIVVVGPQLHSPST